MSKYLYFGAFPKYLGTQNLQKGDRQFNYAQINKDINDYVIQKETVARCFPANFAKFLRKPFLTEQLLETASDFWKDENRKMGKDDL